MTRIVILALCFALASCAAREPQIVTKEVKVAVPTPCNPDLGSRPALMTKEQIKHDLDESPTLDDRVKTVTEQLLLYIGWVPVLEAALNGCKGSPIR